MKLFSDFFRTDLSCKSKIQIRLQETELRCLPYMYLVQFLIFCEKNMISPSSIRVFYFDSTCSLNDNLIAIRFPDFKPSIFFINCIDSSASIPEIPKNDQVLTFIMIDNAKIMRKITFGKIEI